jgi:death-on-curing protein
MASFDGALLYATPFMRAAALLESLVRNHGFIDGNKRVAIMAAAFWLEREGYGLVVSQEDLYERTMEAAQGRLPLDQIAAWLEKGSEPAGG